MKYYFSIGNYYSIAAIFFSNCPIKYPERNTVCMEKNSLRLSHQIGRAACLNSDVSTNTIKKCYPFGYPLWFTNDFFVFESSSIRRSLGKRLIVVLNPHRVRGKLSTQRVVFSGMKKINEDFVKAYCLIFL